MANEAKRLENSRAEITLNAAWKEIKKNYDAQLAKYQKQIVLPGFRKGKAPLSVVETKIGRELLNDAALEAINAVMSEAFEKVDPELRPLPYAQPEVVDYEKLIPFKKDADISFTVRYDVMPEINLTEYKDIPVEYPNVKISDEMVETEIERYRNQNAIVKKKANQTVEKDDLVTVDYVNLDANDESGKVDDFTFTAGKKQNFYRFDDEIMGMKEGESKEFTMKYKADEKPAGLKNDSVHLKVTVKTIKVRELPAVDDEFAQDIKSEYKTVKDMKDGIRKSLEDNLEGRMKETKIQLITEKILEKTKIDVPKSMIDFEIENAFRRFVSQTGADEETFVKYLNSMGQTKESFTAGWRDDAAKTIKSQLIIGKVEKLENIKPNEEKLKSVMDKEVPADADKEQKKRYEDILRDRMTFDETIDFLIKNNKLKPGKEEIKYEDFASGEYLKKKNEDKPEKKSDKKTEKKPEDK